MQCSFSGRAICSDYCTNPEAFTFSDDGTGSQKNVTSISDECNYHPFACLNMLSNEEKLEDFCTCSLMPNINCKASENGVLCENFCIHPNNR